MQKPQIRCSRNALTGEWPMAADSSMPILIVDDYRTMVRIVRNLLNQIGFDNVDEAADGASALQMIAAKPYGLVISDWNMQPMTGLELLQHLRARPETADLPVIMVTAESKTDNVLAARRAGVNSYIVKPFTAALLKQKIDAVFAARTG